MKKPISSHELAKLLLSAPDRPVLLRVYETGLDPVREVMVTSVTQVRDPELDSHSYDGTYEQASHKEDNDVPCIFIGTGKDHCGRISVEGVMIYHSDEIH